MTKALVAYGSKMGATEEIAAAIGEELRRAGIDTTVSDAGDVGPIEDYDAVLVGSAVYATRWRPDAVKLLARLAESKSRPRTWIFQSGPFENVTDSTDQSVPKKVLRFAAALAAPPVTTFGGRNEPGTATGFIARRMAAGPTAGDYRNFTEIRRWAADIATEIGRPVAPADAVARPDN